MDVISFEFAAAAAETQTKTLPVSGGEVMGIWVSDTSGTSSLDIIFTCNGQATTIFDIGEAVNGVYNPVRRMQTIAGVDNSGTGEFQHFFIPPGSTIKAVAGAAWTGKVQIALR